MLNQTKGNMYEFITHTWNVIKGECPHECAYCYMHRWGQQKPVWFDGKELKTNLGKGKFIFVGSSCDMWAGNMPVDYVDWIDRILRHCREYDGNKYFFQTKNPKSLYDYSCLLPEDSHVCTTIETNRIYSQMGKAPKPEDRAHWIGLLENNYVTIEPVMDFDIEEMINLMKTANPKQINIGADSCGHALPEPSPEKLTTLIEALSEFTIVHQKSNLKRLLKKRIEKSEKI